jgi:hypothetical protein
MAYVAGAGFESQYVPVNDRMELGIYIDLPRPLLLTSMCIWVNTNGVPIAAGGLYLKNTDNTNIAFGDFTNVTTNTPGQEECFVPVNATGPRIAIVLTQSGNIEPLLVSSIEIQGNGANPIGPNNCTY